MMTDQSSPDIVARLRKFAHDRREIFGPGERSWMLEAADEIECLRAAWKDAEDRADLYANSRPAAAQSAPEQISFVEALSLAERGLEIWKAKEHNAKWWRRIDGTPIPNDLLVNIAEEFSKCGLVYASTLPSAQCGEGK